jgi:hypothetical protein
MKFSPGVKDFNIIKVDFLHWKFGKNKAGQLI